MNIFNLFGKLTLDNSDYVNKLTNAKKLSRQETAKIKKQFKEMSDANIQALKAIDNAFLQGKISITEYNAKVDELKRKQQEITDASNNLGITSKKSALAMIGGWTAILAVIMKVVSGIKNAIMNTTEYAGTIKDLAQVYGKTYKQIQEVNYLAQESGKSAEWALKRAQSSGLEYWEVLGLTNEQYKEMIANAKDMGIILEDEVIDKADMLGDRISQLKYQWQAVLTGLLAGDEGAEENMRQFFVRVGDMVKEYAPTVVNFGVQLILQILIGVVQQAPQILLDFWYAVQDAMLKIDWIDLIWNILKGLGELIVNSIINNLFGWLRFFGVDIPQVDFTSGSNNTPTIDTGTDYEISENVNQELTIKIESNGVTANDKAVASSLEDLIDEKLGRLLGGV